MRLRAPLVRGLAPLRPWVRTESQSPPVELRRPFFAFLGVELRPDVESILKSNSSPSSSTSCLSQRYCATSNGAPSSAAEAAAEADADADAEADASGGEAEDALLPLAFLLLPLLRATVPFASAVPPALWRSSALVARRWWAEGGSLERACVSMASERLLRVTGRPEPTGSARLKAWHLRSFRL